jgi:hypothetical protein
MDRSLPYRHLEIMMVAWGCLFAAGLPCGYLDSIMQSLSSLALQSLVLA